MKTSVSIYFVKTELETLASELIASQSSSYHTNLLVFSGKNTPYLVNANVFDTIFGFSEGKTKGILKEKRSVYHSLKRLAVEIENAQSNPEKIYIHLPRLSTSKTNYSINYLKRKFPRSAVLVRLIPHGVVSSKLIHITPARRLKLLRRSVNPVNLLFPGLKYYSPKKDLIGGLDEIVDKVYTFQGLETPFPAHKVVELSGLRSYIQLTETTPPNRSAIIIGQPLLENGLISEENHRIVTEQMADWLAENSLDTIYYSKHPRAKQQLDFFRDGYQILEQNGAVEIAFCKIQPEVIISCYSTALATAKVLFGKDVKVVSFGLMLSESNKKEGLATFFHSMGIEVR